MALGVRQNFGYHSAVSSDANPLTIANSNTTPGMVPTNNGNGILLSIAAVGGGSGVGGFTVTDSAGNTTWTRLAARASAASGLVEEVWLGNDLASIVDIVIATTGTPTNLVWCVQAIEVTGSTNLGLDQISVGRSSSATSLTTGATPTLADANDLVWASFAEVAPNTTISSMSSANVLSQLDATVSGHQMSLRSGWTVLSGSTAAQTITASTATAVDYVGIVVTIAAGAPVRTATDSVLLADTATRRGHFGFDSVLLADSAGDISVHNPRDGHDYEVVIVDMYGCAYGQIKTAIPTSVQWVLNDMGSASFTFHIFDPTATCLPINCLPAGREVQIWRDQVLIWWGVPITATFNETEVTINCSGLLWYVSNIMFGPLTINHILDGGFQESGTLGVFVFWAPNLVTDSIENAAAGGQVLTGQYAARLSNTSGVADTDSYLEETISVTPLASDTAFTVSAWVWIDPAFAPATFLEANAGRGLYVNVMAGSTVVFQGTQQITASTPVGVWTRMSVPVGLLPTGFTYTVQVQLYCPVGEVVWDDVQMAAEPGLSVATASVLAQALIDYAQLVSQGKSSFAMPTAATGTPAPGILTRDYGSEVNSGVMQALAEFPTSGYLDYEVTWDATGHFRTFTVFNPSKGTIQYDFPIIMDAGHVTQLTGAVDGSQVGTTQRVLGQGSSGPASDIGYAAFAAFLGSPGGAGFPGGTSPRVVHDGQVNFLNTHLISATANFTSIDVGLPVYDISGLIPIGTSIASITSPTQAELTYPNGSPLGTGTGLTIGIGGIVIEKTASAQPNQPTGALQTLAQGALLRQAAAQVILAPKLRADGPGGLMGNVTVGDVVPVALSYGWATLQGTSGNPVLQRVASLTLLPVTEEIQPVLNVINVTT